MALHRLTTITLAVPDPTAAAAFYRDFGLAETAAGRFATAAGGEQLVLVPAAKRGLAALGLGVDDPDDLGRIARALERLDVAAERTSDALRAREPVTGLPITVTIAPRVTPAPLERVPCNAPGRVERANRPAEAVLRSTPVRPVKLSHLALAAADHEAAIRFFTAGL